MRLEAEMGDELTRSVGVAGRSRQCVPEITMTASRSVRNSSRRHSAPAMCRSVPCAASTCTSLVSVACAAVGHAATLLLCRMKQSVPGGSTASRGGSRRSVCCGMRSASSSGLLEPTFGARVGKRRCGACRTPRASDSACRPAWSIMLGQDRAPRGTDESRCWRLAGRP